MPKSKNPTPIFFMVVKKSAGFTASTAYLLRKIDTPEMTAVINARLTPHLSIAYLFCAEDRFNVPLSFCQDRGVFSKGAG